VVDLGDPADRVRRLCADDIDHQALPGHGIGGRALYTEQMYCHQALPWNEGASGHRADDVFIVRLLTG
jgi:hypothetical protein